MDIIVHVDCNMNNFIDKQLIYICLEKILVFLLFVLFFLILSVTVIDFNYHIFQNTNIEDLT